MARIQRDRALERRLGLVDVDPGQRREAQHHLRAREVGRQRHRLLGGVSGGAQIAEHLLELGETRPGQRVLGAALDRLAQHLARFLELEGGLQRVGQGDRGSAESGLSSTARRASASASSRRFWTTSMTARWASASPASGSSASARAIAASASSTRPTLSSTPAR